jgi:hypothetical protein
LRCKEWLKKGDIRVQAGPQNTEVLDMTLRADLHETLSLQNKPQIGKQMVEDEVTTTWMHFTM